MSEVLAPVPDLLLRLQYRAAVLKRNGPTSTVLTVDNMAIRTVLAGKRDVMAWTAIEGNGPTHKAW